MFGIGSSKFENSKMKSIVSVSQNGKNSLQSFKGTRKASAASGKNRDIVTEIGIDTFNSVREVQIVK